MKKGFILTLKQMSILMVTALITLLFATGVMAETGEIDNQLTVLYKSEEHDFTSLNIDQNKINQVESVSDIVDVIHLKDSNDAPELIEVIKANENVRAVDFNAVAEVEDIPNDKHYKKYQEVYMKNIGFENVVSGPNTAKVAVLDTGVYAGHEDLAGRVEESGYNYINDNNDTSDLEGHGTFIAGIISAGTNNEIGIAGASGNANVLIVPYVVLDENGEGELSGIAAALEDITKRDDIQIINLSLGFDKQNAVLGALCQELVDQGKIVVASSGNYDDDYLLYPAAYTSTISVGAVNSDNVRCSEDDWGVGYGSNYGEGLDIVAPGNDIASLNTENGYQLGSGTSYSAPFMAAACALAVTKDHAANLDQVRSAISSSSADLLTEGWDQETGYGLLQLDKFVDQFSLNLPVESIEITGDKTLELKTGDSRELSVEFKPEGSKGKVNWSSNNEYVATVDNNGLLTAVSGGNCVITAECEGNKAEIEVNVIKTEQAIYRLYNPFNTEHLYTTDTNEVEELRNNGWNYEGTGWVSPLKGTPVYRLYHAGIDEHLYTVDMNEVKELQNRGWTVDKNSTPLFYSGGDNPIYRLYNEGVKRHLLTTDLNEYNVLPDQGWTQENIALYSVR